jgi:hypothetical protein
VVDAGTGWPGIVDVLLPSDKHVRVALHVSLVTSHSRKPYERRFQNPANRSLVREDAGLPVLIGLARINDRYILVATDGKGRVGRESRFSLLFKDTVIAQALKSGWAMYQSHTGERIYAFIPLLMPVYVQLLKDGLDSDLSEPVNSSIQVAVSASGIIEAPSEPAFERTRRAANVLIRDYAFGREVVHAYGDRCAMCGIDSGLVVGAHIFPVEALASRDRVWNGLALCQNHHAAFDQHKIWVNPTSRAILFHPSITSQNTPSQALQAFIGNTFPVLASPSEASKRPKQEMFLARYEFFGAQYHWASAQLPH